MKIRSIVLDIDGVIKPRDRGVDKKTIDTIVQMQRKHRVIFASGKSIEYMRGGLSFTDLLTPYTILIGETGGVIYFNGERKTLYSTLYVEDLDFLEDQLDYKGVDFFKEDKTTCLTIFSQTLSLEQLYKECKTIIDKENLNLYIVKHHDCIDVLQRGVDKGEALEMLEELDYLNLDETAAIGDGPNDVSMLRKVALPLCPLNSIPDVKKLCKHVAPYTYGEALEYLMEVIESKQ